MLTLRYDDGGIPRSLDLLADSISNLKPIFKRIAHYKWPEIQRRFDAQGPGWPPLAQSTLEKRQEALAAGKGAQLRSHQYGRLRAKLGREAVRAERNAARRIERLGRAPGAREFGSEAARKYGRALTQKDRILGRHAGLAAELERLAQGGQGPLQKQHQGLQGRIERAEGRAQEKLKKFESGEALGAIASSIRVDIEKDRLTILSRIPWAGVHNEGGSAGRGAKIPPRTFLEWTPQDLQQIPLIARQYMIEKWNRGT